MGVCSPRRCQKCQCSFEPVEECEMRELFECGMCMVVVQMFVSVLCVRVSGTTKGEYRYEGKAREKQEAVVFSPTQEKEEGERSGL